MQRKNNLLKSTSRNGMAMIMAISVIVIVSTILILSLSLTTQTAKRTTDLYVYEQAVLLSKSAAEYALLQISQNGCIDNLGFEHDYYDINITMQYIYTEASTCTDYFTINTDEQNGSVLMDITVSVDDSTITSEPITYFRRSIQKL
ncbi:hypothetical protein [Sulfurimonas sp.]